MKMLLISKEKFTELFHNSKNVELISVDKLKTTKEQWLIDKTAYLNETVTETDGSISQYFFEIEEE